MHDYRDLINIFNSLFQESEQTILLKGEGEPIYLPASDGQSYCQVIFAHGFYQSALHEIAHWCIAGKERRLLVDYGYWYQPDGRTAEQQRVFQGVESKPQAIEWLFSLAAGSRFYVSADNLSGQEVDDCSFKQAVYTQAIGYLINGLPDRAELFKQALHQFYGKPKLDHDMLILEQI